MRDIEGMCMTWMGRIDQEKTQGLGAYSTLRGLS